MYDKDIFLGLDYGHRRIGVAVGQKITKNSRPLDYISVNFGIPDWYSFKKLITDWNPKSIIIGLPININGKKQNITNSVYNFSNQIQDRFCISTYFSDERLSTIEAKSTLFSIGGYQKIKNSNIDSIAACIILDQWLKSN